MDLATVKAAVKTWEKSFRLREGRDPTKDDIKRDPGNIAKQYALYRKLSKPASFSQSQSQSQSKSQRQSSPSRSERPSLPPSTSSSSQSHSLSQSSLTPRNIPSSEYPTTPTPPTRRSSSNISRSHSSASASASATQSHSRGQPIFQADSQISSSRSQAGPSRSNSSGNPAIARGNGDSKNDVRSLKRKASKPALDHSDPHSSPPPASTTITASISVSSSKLATSTSSTSSTSTARTLFSTPKKNAYTGPVHDPNPVNPFTITTPTKSSPLNNGHSNSSALKHTNSFESPFIHASSPRKLKEVLEANSLHRVRERVGVGVGAGSATKNEVTPRTRARKRLRGEQVEDTPIKDKLPRRRKGQGQGQGSNPNGARNAPLSDDAGFLGKPREADHGALEELDDDELGPSPMKGSTADAGTGKGFTSLFGEFEAETRSSQVIGTDMSSNLELSGRDGGERAVGITKLSETRRRGRPSEMMGLFGRLGKSTIQPKIIPQPDETEDQGTDGDHRLLGGASPTPDPVGESSTSIRIQVQASPSPSPSPTPAPAPLPFINDETLDKLRPSLDDPELGLAPEAPDSRDRSPSASQQRKKVISLSDDEQDEWDPEGGHVRRQVFIVPTRREIKRRGSDSSDIGSRPIGGSTISAEAENADLQEEDAEDETEEGDGTISHSSDVEAEFLQPNATAPNGSSSFTQANGRLSLPMLNLLSLRSPSKTKAGQTRAKLEELRVKALFDPVAQAQLKAMQRGQDIAFTGESRDVDNDEGDEDDLLERYEFGLKEQGRFGNEQEDADTRGVPLSLGELGGDGDGEGDDDWEEESDGWKREQADEDW
ncbi:hypothetical protein IAT40_001723 [Kwoniella sp. CBS 6097]